MLSMSNSGQVRLTRGDTLELPVSINAGTNLEPVQYILGEDDELFFALMEPNQIFEMAILKKKYTGKDICEDGDVRIVFEPEDTQYLLPGLYYYQVKVRLFDTERQKYIVNTIIPKTHFWIEE